MKVHNSAEEQVFAAVTEIFDAEEAKEKKRFCTCELCRTDVACFVLNRMPPMYQTSGRGLAHRELDYQEKLQREADLVALVYQGIERITIARRSHVGRCEETHEDQTIKGFFFNFPQILGRLFHSTSFEPLTGIHVRLLSEDGLEMKMTDFRWSNPCIIPESTPGVFLFWPVPERAAESGIQRSFELKIAVDDAGFESLRHYFTVSLASEEGYLGYASGNRVLALPDLFLIPR
jgi:competence protein ComFB